MTKAYKKRELIIQLCLSEVSESVTLMGQEGCVLGYKEADVSMISSMKMCIDQGKQPILVLSDDTEVCILLMYFFWKWQPDISIMPRVAVAQYLTYI